MSALLELSDDLWTGETNTHANHPFVALNEHEEVAERTIFYNSFAGVTAFKTDDGLVMVDSGIFVAQEAVFQAIRKGNRPHGHEHP